MRTIHGSERKNSGGHFGIFSIFIGAVLAEIFGIEVRHIAGVRLYGTYVVARRRGII